MNGIEQLLANPRVTVRRDGSPRAGGACVVYWMQRAQRGVDNPALDVAIAAAKKFRVAFQRHGGAHLRSRPGAN
jgi:hypothetical protein